jgi:hypothetical protein
VPIVLKSGSLNLLEPSGPVKGCNGIALALPVLHCNRCLTTEYSETTAHCNGNFDTDNQIYVTQSKCTVTFRTYCITKLTYLLLNVTFQLTVTTTRFRTSVYMNTFPCFEVNNSLLKFVQAISFMLYNFKVIYFHLAVNHMCTFHDILS